MSDFNRLDEPPPIQRSRTVPPPAPFSASRFLGRRERPAGKPARRSEKQARSSEKPSRGERERSFRRPSARVVAMVVVALALIAAHAWTWQRLEAVRTDLTLAGTQLEEARNSLTMLWDTTNKLDEDQMARLSLLADSIRSVFAYAQGEIKLWEAAYYAQEQRLDENAGAIRRHADAITRMTTAANAMSGRLTELANTDRAQLARLDALTREDRTHGTLIETLAQRTQTQESTVRNVASTLSSLRETLAELDGELGSLEGQLSASSSAYAQLDSRLSGLVGWADGFRRAGLTANAVEDRLATLAEELRRVRTHVDSLRSSRMPIRITDGSQ